jgi:hypothetical protein
VSLDAALFILAAVLPIAMAAIGGHLASEKLGYRISFWSLGVATAAIIIIIGIRNERIQTALQNQLTAIQKNTEQPAKPPIVNVPAPVVDLPPSGPRGAAVVIENRVDSPYPQVDANGKETGEYFAFVLGQPVAFNVFTINNGPEVAEDVQEDTRVYIEKGGNEEDAEKVAIAHFKDRLKTAKRSSPSPMQVGGAGEFWTTSESDRVATKEDIALLNKGEELIFLFNYVKWRDTTGWHYLKTCRSVQPPAFQPTVWHVCSGYNEHR